MNKVDMLVGTLNGDIIHMVMFEGTGHAKKVIETGVPIHGMGPTLDHYAKKMGVNIFPYLTATPKDINMALQNAKN